MDILSKIIKGILLKYFLVNTIDLLFQGDEARRQLGSKESPSLRYWMAVVSDFSEE